jgi:streptogramin lyase
MDVKTGRPTKSIGGGLFVFPHGLHVDRDGNVWVTDAQASKDGTKGHQVIQLSPDGKVPGHQTDNPDGAAGEGIVADPAGHLYAAENTLRGVTKYAKQ